MAQDRKHFCQREMKSLLKTIQSLCALRAVIEANRRLTFEDELMSGRVTSLEQLSLAEFSGE